MIPIASGVRVWIATGHTDMRRGMNTLALQRFVWPQASDGAVVITPAQLGYMLDDYC
jgi:transposase